MPERVNIKPIIQRSCVFSHLNTLEYTRALALQIHTRNAKINNPLEPDRLFFLEHPRVFTLGRRGGRENLTVSEDFLASRGIEILETDRGGNITFHGPGQAVLYPIIDLEQARIGVADFVHGMEEIMKQTVREFDIRADRDVKNHGLWVGPRKIGSVGLSIKKGISIHGLALNVCPDLTPFSWINPCGLENVAMTSVAMEAGLDNTKNKNTENNNKEMMERVCQLFCHHFTTIFDITIIKE